MKRAEAVEHVRSVARSCRGKHVRRTSVVVALLASAIAQARAKEDAPDELKAPWFTDEMKAKLLACPTAKDAQVVLLEAGHNTHAHLVDTIARKGGCGADINDLIVAQPFDAEAYTLPCPRCKVEIGFNTPYIEIDADDPERLEGDPLPVVEG
jgi:hypothetical protein